MNELDQIKELEKENWKLDLPMMTKKEIEKTISYIKDKDIVFEWGAGGSTYYFPQYVKRYISIEHDMNWFKIARNGIRKKNLKNVELYHIPPDLDIMSKEPSEIKYRTYLDFIDTLQYRRYDVIIVDGRARAESAIKSLNYMDKNSVLIFHDYERKEYVHWIEPYFDFIDSVDEGTTLAIMRKK